MPKCLGEAPDTDSPWSVLSSLVWKPQVAVVGDILRDHVVHLPQYSYEGDEYGDTELDFSVVWDGDFPIDKPATFRGEGRDGAEELAFWGRVGRSWGQILLGDPLLEFPKFPIAAPQQCPLCPQLSCISAGHRDPAVASASKLTPASTVAGVYRSTGASFGPTVRPPRPTGCTQARRAHAAATPALPRLAFSTFHLPGTWDSWLTLSPPILLCRSTHSWGQRREAPGSLSWARTWDSPTERWAYGWLVCVATPLPPSTSALRGECGCVGAQVSAPRLALTFSDPPPRIVCEMEESLVPSPPPGPVELCVGDCSTDFRTQSEQLYSFVVCKLPAPSHTHSFWVGVALPALGCFLPPLRATSLTDPNIQPCESQSGPSFWGHTSHHLWKLSRCR